MKSLILYHELSWTVCLLLTSQSKKKNVTPSIQIFKSSGKVRVNFRRWGAACSWITYVWLNKTSPKVNGNAGEGQNNIFNLTESDKDKTTWHQLTNKIKLWRRQEPHCWRLTLLCNRWGEIISCLSWAHPAGTARGVNSQMCYCSVPPCDTLHSP